jgi:hypothetical protein
VPSLVVLITHREPPGLVPTWRPGEGRRARPEG